MDINNIMNALEAKHPGEKEFLQAVREVLMSVVDVYNQHPEFERNKIIERMVEPDKIVTFRVSWLDDKGEVQNNIGYRVQFNRELGYMYGMYKKLVDEHTGTFTGKGFDFGGSRLRPEATGFGALYFVQNMLALKNEDLKGKTVAISGFGNVAWGAATKATELGAKVVTISGPDGYVYDPDGISGEKIEYMLELRASGNDIVAPYAEKYPNATFFAGKKPWEQKVDIALPCATQNEVNGEDAKQLVANGVKLVAEVSNMGCTPEAIDCFIENKINYAPGKAVNAGGVACSGLEMTQDAEHLQWTAEEVDAKLHQIMAAIHEQCLKYGMQEEGYLNYMKGANIAGFMKVATAMMEQGVI